MFATHIRGYDEARILICGAWGPIGPHETSNYHRMFVDRVPDRDEQRDVLARALVDMQGEGFTFSLDYTVDQLLARLEEVIA